MKLFYFAVVMGSFCAAMVVVNLAWGSTFGAAIMAACVIVNIGTALIGLKTQDN